MSYLRLQRPAVLLSAQPHLNLVAIVAAKLSGNRTASILTEHAPPSLEIAFYGGWRYRALQALVPLIYRGADRVVGVSQGICAELRSKLPPDRIELIHNPIIPDEFLDLAGVPVPHEWLAEGEVPVVMGVGRLAPEKDFLSLVRAVAHLAQSRPVRLMILGEGPERERIIGLAASLGLSRQIALPGRVDNIFAWLSRASVFVLSSLFEGFGNVLAEALACGRPAIATDCPVGPREILEGGLFGQLVPVGDVAAMVRAIEQALDAPIHPHGLQDHVHRFNVSTSVARYSRLIAEVGASKRGEAAAVRQRARRQQI